MNEKEALLNQLRDVELPEVSGMPAPGWWLLVLLLVILVAAALFFYRRWRSRLWQRQAQAELQNIRSIQPGDESNSSLLSRCSQLARKVVLAADHRDQVAPLHGEQWLAKLDDICGQPEFSQGIGRLLLDQPYQKQPVLAEQDISALFDSMEVLIDSAGRYRSIESAALKVSANKKRSP